MLELKGKGVGEIKPLKELMAKGNNEPQRITGLFRKDKISIHIWIKEMIKEQTGIGADSRGITKRFSL